MKGFFRLVLWTAVLGVTAYGLLRLFLFDLVEVGHNDMAPTLVEGDSFLLYRHGERKHGDVVVCEHPTEQGRPVVGRIVAMAGQTVAIRRNALVVDNRPIETDVPSPAQLHLIDRAGRRDLNLERRREHLGAESWMVLYGARPIDFAARRVERGYFLLADNRSYGADSRHLGEFDSSTCRGVAVAILTAGQGNGSDLDNEAGSRRLSFIR